MPTYNWKEFLERWNEELHEPEFRYAYYGGREDYEEFTTEEWDRFIQSELSLGASEIEIVRVEERLGKRLPPSYWEFLKVTNGWGQHSHLLLELWSVKEISWFRQEAEGHLTIWDEQDKNKLAKEIKLGRMESELVVQSWEEIGKHEELPKHHFLATLEIGGFDGNDWYLLNPLVVNSDGEWEAWIFGKYYGLEKYSSFWNMMQSVYKGDFLSFWKK